MKTSEVVRKIIIRRISYNLACSAILWIFSVLIFYTLFLLFPSFFIIAGLIAPLPLIITFFLLFLIPAVFLVRKFPIFGKSFFQSIISGPFSSGDIKTALELEKNKSFPGENDTDTSFTFYLSSRFNERIQGFIQSGKISIREYLNVKRVMISAVIIIAAVLLSFARRHLVVDVCTALMTGLPAELIALDAPVKFNKLEAHLIPPAYLDSESITVNLNVKNKIKVIQGSGVIIKGEIDFVKSGRLILSTGKDVEYFTINVSDNSFEASFLAPMKGAFALELSFSKPVSGRYSGKSQVFSIEAMPDAPPKIKIFSPPVDYNVIFGNSVAIDFTASDDYGILEISLYHRSPEVRKDYLKELVARFPKNPKTSYTSTYVWNPVMREGEKMNELLYEPGTKMVEYYLEVKDINNFSYGGTSRTETRFIHFTDMYASLKEGINLIQELINDGNKLLKTLNEKRIIEYRKKLIHASGIFTKELGEALPQSSLIQKTNDMINLLYIENPEKIKEPLSSYIAYLERYLVFINLLLQSEAGIDEKAMLNDLNSTVDFKNALKRISPAAELLEKEFKNDIERINELLRKGEYEKAKIEISELMKKIKSRLEEEYSKSRAMSMKIAKEITQKIEELTAQAKDIIKKEETNITITDQKKIEQAILKQDEINQELSDLSNKTGKLSSDYPFIMYSLNSYAGAARLYGDRAMQSLQKSDHLKASHDQKQVIQFLKNFTDSLSQQKKLMDELAKGNFDRLASGGFTSRFVLIPKEAMYTIPIDFKNKIIEMSRDRSKISKEKEAFWRDILE